MEEACQLFERKVFIFVFSWLYFGSSHVWAVRSGMLSGVLRLLLEKTGENYRRRIDWASTYEGKVKASQRPQLM